MTVSPDTRPSLILRLKDRHDCQAWTTFVAIYEPLLMRLCQQSGMQPADASEATQEVLLHLSKVVEKWNPDKELGSFRSWLYRVSRNVVIRFLKNKNRDRLITDCSDIHRIISESSVPTHAQQNEYDIEFRRRVFVWACERLRTEFQKTTWQAFWQTQVLKNPIAQVSDKLGLSVGAIYIARSRVMKRLKETVQQQIDSNWYQFDYENSQRI